MQSPKQIQQQQLRQQQQRRQEHQQEQHQDEQKQQLGSTLARNGWAQVQLRPSIIRIALASLLSVSPSSSLQSSPSPSSSSSSQRGAVLSQRLWVDTTAWKRVLLDLFENQRDTVIPGGVYREAESGGTSAEVEPKESWEVQRCSYGKTTTNNENDDDDDGGDKEDINTQDRKVVKNNKNCNEQQAEQQQQQQHVLYDWIQLLHQIAICVRTSLELPPNVLLQEDSHSCCSSSQSKQQHQPPPPSNSAILSSVPSTDTSPPKAGSVDLLRAFYYHAVEPPTKTTTKKHLGDLADSTDDEDEESRVLGSSPHTDWGSFTVIWQDDVGGLETYCHAHKRWTSVHPLSSSWSTTSTTRTTTTTGNDENNDNQQDVVSFVVHVGDMTSLALGLAGGAHPIVNTTSKGPHVSDEIANDRTKPSCDVVDVVDWPSPRHRVISPDQETRVSLVYFAYPPPEISLATLVQSFREHAQIAPNSIYLQQSCRQRSSVQDRSDQTNQKERRILPLDEYYLLQNQSAGSPRPDNSMTNNKNVGEDRKLLASDQLDHIMNLPVRIVLMDKWNQVQRSY